MADSASQAAAVLAQPAAATGALDFDVQALFGAGAGVIDLPLHPLPPGDAVLDPETGQWIPLRPGDYEARAVRGEQNMGFALAREKGRVFIAGPSGTQAGHRFNAPAEDGAVFDLDGEFNLFILDNKAEQARTVRKASALTDNRPNTLVGLRNRVMDPSFNDMPRIEQVRKALQTAVDNDAANVPLPRDVTLAVTNAGGRSKRVSRALARSGIQFLDLATDNQAPTSLPAKQPAALTSPPANNSLVNALATQAVGIGAGLVAEWLKDKLRESLQRMPPPTASPGSIWSVEGLKGRLPLDLVASHLGESGPGFESRRGRLAVEMAAGWAEADRVPKEGRTAVFARMRQRVARDQTELQDIESNVQQSLTMEPQMVAAVAAARDLLAMLDHPGGFKAGYDIGFTVQELSRLGANLSWYAASLDRGVLAPLRYLQRRTQDAREENQRTLRQIAEAEAAP